MNSNRAEEMRDSEEGSSQSSKSSNDLDVIDLFREDRERKLKATRDSQDEPGAGGGAGRRRSPSSIESDQDRKVDPRRSAIVRLAELAGRALPVLSATTGELNSAAGAPETFENQTARSSHLPSFDLV